MHEKFTSTFLFVSLWKFEKKLLPCVVCFSFLAPCCDEVDPVLNGNFSYLAQFSLVYETRHWYEMVSDSRSRLWTRSSHNIIQIHISVMWD